VGVSSTDVQIGAATTDEDGGDLTNAVAAAVSAALGAQVSSHFLRCAFTLADIFVLFRSPRSIPGPLLRLPLRR
jgi:hypothetical protein